MSKKLQYLLIGLLIVGTPECYTATASPGATIGIPPKEVSLKDTAANVRRKLQDPRIQVEIKVIHGANKVYLSGTVSSKEEVAKAIQRVRDLGVIGRWVNSAELKHSPEAPSIGVFVREKILQGLDGDSRIHSKVFRTGDGTLTVRLTGTVRSKAEDLSITKQVENLKLVDCVISALEVKADAPGPPKEKKDEPATKVVRWPLTFLPSPINSGDVMDIYDNNSVVTTLNQIYGKETVSYTRGALLIKGTDATILDIKRLLAQLDAPRPQVQMDVWAFQIAGKPGIKYDKALKNLESTINNAQKDLVLATNDGLFPAVSQVLCSGNSQYFRSDTQELKRQLQEHLHFNTNTRRPLSLTEMIVFLALANQCGREEVIKRAEEKLQLAKRGEALTALRHAFGVPEIDATKYPKENQYSIQEFFYSNRTTNSITVQIVVENNAPRSHSMAAALLQKRLQHWLQENDNRKTKVKIVTEPVDGVSYQIIFSCHNNPDSQGIRVGEDKGTKVLSLVTDNKGIIAFELANDLIHILEQPNKTIPSDPGWSATVDQKGIAELIRALIDYKLCNDRNAANKYYKKEWEAVKDKLECENPGWKNGDWSKYNLDALANFEDSDWRVEFKDAEELKDANCTTEKQKKKLEDALIKRVVTKRMQRAPEELRRAAATGDRLLKAAVTAFTSDMQRIYLNPALDDLRAKNDGGEISLVGNTRLVVTSGLESSVNAEMRSYVNSTRPRPFDLNMLNTAFPQIASADTTNKTTNIVANKTIQNLIEKSITEDTTTTDNTEESTSSSNNLTGSVAVLAKLSQLEAFLLANALSQPDPTFAEIAPGLDIKVKPTVLPDGASARLQVDLRFGVEVTKDDKENTGVLHWPQPDAVKSHHVTTDAIISAFDLFNISSFAIDTSYPRPPGYVPVLGQLPLVGKAFQWRRKNAYLDHQSIILLNTVILPRAMDMARFYGN